MFVLHSKIGPGLEFWLIIRSPISSEAIFDEFHLNSPIRSIDSRLEIGYSILWTGHQFFKTNNEKNALMENRPYFIQQFILIR